MYCAPPGVSQSWRGVLDSCLRDLDEVLEHVERVGEHEAAAAGEEAREGADGHEGREVRQRREMRVVAPGEVTRSVVDAELVEQEGARAGHRPHERARGRGSEDDGHAERRTETEPRPPEGEDPGEHGAVGERRGEQQALRDREGRKEPVGRRHTGISNGIDPKRK